MREIRKEKNALEQSLAIKILIDGKKVSIQGEPVKEFTAERVLIAINFGFSAKISLTLKDSDMDFKIINIKNFTRRKNLHEIRARLIGTEGKTKRTIENIADCELVINEKDNSVGIIAMADEIDEITTAIQNLIRGSTQSNVYAFLERMNAERKKFPEDLGLKIKEKEE